MVFLVGGTKYGVRYGQVSVIRRFDCTLNDERRQWLSRMSSGHDDDQPLVVGHVAVDVVRDGRQ